VSGLLLSRRRVAFQPGITNHVAAMVTGTIWAKAARALSRKYLSRSFFRAVIKDMPSALLSKTCRRTTQERQP
jgi:hypothetical protein